MQLWASRETRRERWATAGRTRRSQETGERANGQRADGHGGQLGVRGRTFPIDRRPLNPLQGVCLGTAPRTATAMPWRGEVCEWRSACGASVAGASEWRLLTNRPRASQQAAPAECEPPASESVVVLHGRSGLNGQRAFGSPAHSQRSHSPSRHAAVQTARYENFVETNISGGLRPASTICADRAIGGHSYPSWERPLVDFSPKAITPAAGRRERPQCESLTT